MSKFVGGRSHNGIKIVRHKGNIITSMLASIITRKTRLIHVNRLAEITSTAQRFTMRQKHRIFNWLIDQPASNTIQPIGINMSLINGNGKPENTFGVVSSAWNVLGFQAIKTFELDNLPCISQVMPCMDGTDYLNSSHPIPYRTTRDWLKPHRFNALQWDGQSSLMACSARCLTGGMTDQCRQY